MQSAKKRNHSKAFWWVLVAAVVAIAATFMMSDKFVRQHYPLKYTSDIENNAERYGLDPYLVAAVIKTESNFNPEAVSRAGAVGLMQIMPETGDWIAQKIGVKSFHTDMLYEPARNIEFGCWYLQFLSDRFGADPELVSAAYNAGHNRVNSWLADDDISSDGEHLNNIPYPETKAYVERIQDAYAEYVELYPDAFEHVDPR